jgi:hypothetical protein
MPEEMSQSNQVAQQSSQQETALRLRSPEAVRQYGELLQLVGVSADERHRVANLVWRLVGGRVSASEFLELLQERLFLREEAAVSFATSLASQMLLPMQDELSLDVETLIREWTGTGFSGKPLPERFVQEYVRGLEEVDDTHEQQRYESILLNYLTNRATREQSIERMGRSVKLNGLAMEAVLAEQVLQAFDAATEGKQFDFGGLQPPEEEEVPEVIEEEPVEDVQPETEEAVETAPVVPKVQMPELAPEPEVPEVKEQKEEQPEPRPEPVATKKPAKPRIDAFTPEDEAEVANIKEARAELLNTSLVTDVGSVVKQICENPVFSFEDPLLEDRCAKVVESRVRGVRNPFQTRSQFERSVDKGGLGVSGRRLADLMQAIETHVHAYEKNYAEHHGALREKAKQEAIEKQDQRAEHAKAEERHMTKRYVELTGKMPGESVAPAAPSARRTSAAISAHHELQQQAGRIDAARVKQVIDQTKEVQPKRRPQVRKPSMQEVVFEKRLAGPTDELRQMTLTDFRRLSSDPQQAATKVFDKAELLEEQGHDKKVAAVEAWRESPVNRLYVALTRQAVLDGVPVMEVLNQKRTAGEDVFTDEELDAVMKLNDRLRF